MTKLLDDALQLARGLPDDQQDELAARIIAELTKEEEFDCKIAATVDQLDWLIEEARAEDRADLTREWDADRHLPTSLGPGDPPPSAGMRRSLELVERSAGMLKRYAKQPPLTAEQERDAFERGVAIEVMEHM